MVQKISKELAKHRLEQAKEDLEAGKLLYDKNFYKSANNRAYYSIFHSIKAVLALEPIDFKRHKDVLAYFNKNYINKETINDDEFELICSIIKLRNELKLTQRELAEKSGVSQPNIVRFEHINHSATLATTLRILNAMGYSLKIYKK